MRYRAMVAALATAGLLATGIGFAQAPGLGIRQGGGGRPGAGMRGPAGGGLEGLDLTDDQREQLRQLRQEQREADEALFGKMPELQQQLHQAIFSGKGDVAGIAQQINELQAQLLQARIAHQQKVAAILTAQQRQQVAAKSHAGPGRMGPRGRGPGGF